MNGKNLYLIVENMDYYTLVHGSRDGLATCCCGKEITKDNDWGLLERGDINCNGCKDVLGIREDNLFVNLLKKVGLK